MSSIKKAFSSSGFNLGYMKKHKNSFSAFLQRVKTLIFGDDRDSRIEKLKNDFGSSLIKNIPDSKDITSKINK